MLSISKKYRNNEETQQPAWNAQVLNFLQAFQRGVVKKAGVEASYTLGLLALQTRGGPGAPSDFPES